MAALSAAGEEGFDAVALQVVLALDPYLYNRRQYGELLEVADIAAAAARRLADRNGEGRALMSRAAALYRLGRYGDALIACQRALDIFRETGDREEEAKSLALAGASLADLSRPEEAVTYGQEAVATCREAGDTRGAGGALVTIAFTLRTCGQPDEAVIAAQDAVTAFRETSDILREGQALAALGMAHLDLGNVDQAVNAATESARCFGEFGHRANQASMLCNLATALTRDRPGEALAPLSEAAEIYRQTGDRRREAETRSRLGIVLTGLGSLPEASEAFQAAAAVFGEIGDKAHAAQARALARPHVRRSRRGRG
jgi:tetratricopeptide (TPR) repeat protein